MLQVNMYLVLRLSEKINYSIFHLLIFFLQKIINITLKSGCLQFEIKRHLFSQWNMLHIDLFSFAHYNLYYIDSE